jgi:hypothetical protein
MPSGFSPTISKICSKRLTCPSVSFRCTANAPLSSSDSAASPSAAEL